MSTYPAERRLGTLLWLALVSGVCGILAIATVRAQVGSSDPGFLFSPQRLEALVEALRSDLQYIPGEVLVKFRQGTTGAEQASALSVARGPVSEREVRWIGDLVLLRFPLEPDAEQLARILSAQPEVEYAHPNYLAKLQAVPNDPGFSRQWNFEMLGMPRAWEINPGGSASVIVAVIDSGVTQVSQTFSFPTWTGRRISLVGVPYRTNPDLDAGRFAAARDFVFWTGPVLDMNGHGTHVAGTVAQSTNNGLGYAGIAYNVQLMSLKACLSYWERQFVWSALGRQGFFPPFHGCAFPTDATVEAIRYAADQGAKVINLSLGGPGPAPAYLDAIRYAVQRGAFVAMAMGNEFEDGNPVVYPAAYATQVDGAVSVGAVGRSLRRAYYSNTGTHIELAAPGGDRRDGGTAGQVYQAGLVEGDFDPDTIIVPRFDRYTDVPYQGTSMATPHVAGLAALLISQGITSPAAVEAAMKRFARDLGSPGRDTEYGYGLIQPRETLRGLGLAR